MSSQKPVEQMNLKHRDARAVFSTKGVNYADAWNRFHVRGTRRIGNQQIIDIIALCTLRQAFQEGWGWGGGDASQSAAPGPIVFSLF